MQGSMADTVSVKMRRQTNSRFGLLVKGETYTGIPRKTAERWQGYGIADVVDGASTAEPAQGPYALGERRGSYYPIVGASGQEIETVQGREAAEQRVKELNS